MFSCPTSDLDNLLARDLAARFNEQQSNKAKKCLALQIMRFKEAEEVFAIGVD